MQYTQKQAQIIFNVFSKLTMGSIGKDDVQDVIDILEVSRELANEVESVEATVE